MFAMRPEDKSDSLSWIIPLAFAVVMLGMVAVWIVSRGSSAADAVSDVSAQSAVADSVASDPKPTPAPPKPKNWMIDYNDNAWTGNYR